MPLPTIPSGNVASALGGAYEVANSCRFNFADSPKLSKSVSSGSGSTKFTFSCWFKTTTVNSSYGRLLWNGDSGGSYETHITLYADGRLAVYWNNGSDGARSWLTNRYLRDPSAWYNLVVIYDSTDGTAGDRLQIWINGVRETSFSESTNPSSNEVINVFKADVLAIGREVTSADRFSFDGYLAEVCVIDGTDYPATSFGEFDEDSPRIWKPIDVSGLTFGTNGFYLDFEDSANLGNDANGGTDLDESNIAAGDQVQDSPTNNFCVMNPLDNYFNDADFSQGNTVIYTNGGAVYTFNTATFFLSAGRWYWEVKVAAGTNGTGTAYICGISDEPTAATSQELGNEGTQWGYYGAGHIRHNNGNDGSYTTYTAGDTVGVYLDLEDNKLYFSKNGTLENSGTGVSITAVTNSAISNGGYFPASGYFDGDASSNAAYFYHNFGNGDFNGTAVSSSVADDNGYGLFEYSPNITGDGSAKKFYSLCTKNLALYG